MENNIKPDKKPEKEKIKRPTEINKSKLHGLWTLTHRDLRKWYTNPYQFFISLFQPIIWLALFGKALNFGDIIASSGGTPAEQNAILLSFFGTTSYFSFLSCGIIAFIVLFTSAFSGMSVVFDRRFGFLNKALTTPVARGTIVMSKIFQSVGRSLTQAGIVLIIAVLLGMTTSHFSVLGIIGTFLIIFLLAIGLSALFVMLALRSSDWQTQMALINLINLPLLFASNALFPTKAMPSWLRNVADINPVSYANDAIRQMLLGSVGSTPLWADFAIMIGFAGFFSTIGIILSWRLLSK
jgi:ABC-2 type transport system permease protein